MSLATRRLSGALILLHKKSQYRPKQQEHKRHIPESEIAGITENSQKNDHSPAAEVEWLLLSSRRECITRNIINLHFSPGGKIRHNYDHKPAGRFFTSTWSVIVFPSETKLSLSLSMRGFVPC